MEVREFIYSVINGSLFNDDILNFAKNSWNKQNLIWDLQLATVGIDPVTGKPYVNSEQEYNRLYDAINTICNQFGLSLLEESSTQQPTEQPQPEVKKPNEKKPYTTVMRKRGRPSRSFESCMRIERKDADKIKSRLKELVKSGTGPVALARIIYGLVDLGVMVKPSFEQLAKAIGMTAVHGAFDTEYSKLSDPKNPHYKDGLHIEAQLKMILRDINTN